MDFPGVALVTGAASGMGKATALLYAKEGCKRISIADINVHLLQTTQDEIKKNYPATEVKAIPVDVRSQESVQAMVDETVRSFGRIDYCGNIAGIIRFGDTAVLSAEDFDLLYQVDLRGVFFVSQAVIKVMLSQEPITNTNSPYPTRGALVNLASIAGLIGVGNLPAYSAMKHGVVGLSKSDGQRFARSGIRVNALCPGSIQTPMMNMNLTGEEGRKRDQQRDWELSMGRIGQPEEMAECVIWLTSGRSSFITGAVLEAHGGLKNR